MEDDWLRGQGRSASRSNATRGGGLLAFADYDPRSSAGGDVALTLDAALQAEAEAALDEVVEATGGARRPGASCSIRRAATCSRSPRAPASIRTASAPRPTPRRARTPSSTRSSPGSTVKPFVVAAALEKGVLAHGRDHRLRERQLPRARQDRARPASVRLLDPSGHPARLVQHRRRQDRLPRRPRAPPRRCCARFGFGRAHGQPLPGRVAPGCCGRGSSWRPVDHATIAFGQGMTVTPMQLANAFAVLANGGDWRAPRLVAARRAPDGAVGAPAALAEPRRVLRRGRGGDGARHARDGGRPGRHGPPRRARAASASPARPAPRRSSRPDGTYSLHRYQAGSSGVAPADAPRFVIVAMVDEPRGFVHTGGATAAPLFARVAAAALARDGILTEPELPLPEWARADWVPPWKTAAPKPKARRGRRRRERPAEADRAPRPRPLGASRKRSAQRAEEQVRRAKRRASTTASCCPTSAASRPSRCAASCSGLGIAIQVSGSGRAVAQEPAPGTILRGGSRARALRHAPGGARLMRLSALLAALPPDARAALAAARWTRASAASAPTRAPWRRATCSSRCAAPTPTGTPTWRRRSRSAPSRCWSRRSRGRALPPAAVVADTRRALAPLAARFFGDPASELTLVGVTGTNGKTSTTFLIESILAAAGRRTGLIGTVEVRYADERHRALNTTPESLELQRLLREMRTRGVDAVGDGGLLARPRARPRRRAAASTPPRSPTSRRTTSTSTATWTAYAEAKCLLFREHLKPGGAGVINLDDPRAEAFLAAARAGGGAHARRHAHGRASRPTCASKPPRSASTASARGSPCPPGPLDARAAAGRRLQRREPARRGRHRGRRSASRLPTIARGVAACPQVPGRVERVATGGAEAPIVLVDYAHTPDAVEKVLRTVRPLARAG